MVAQDAGKAPSIAVEELTRKGWHLWLRKGRGDVSLKAMSSGNVVGENALGRPLWAPRQQVGRPQQWKMQERMRSGSPYGLPEGMQDNPSGGEWWGAP